MTNGDDGDWWTNGCTKLNDNEDDDDDDDYDDDDDDDDVIANLIMAVELWRYNGPVTVKPVGWDKLVAYAW